MAYGIDIVIGIKVYHIARCRDLNGSNDCIYYAVTEGRLCRYQLQRQECTFTCLNIAEHGICTYTGQQECHSSTHQLVIQIHQPDVAVTVHTNIIHLLRVGVQVLSYKQRIGG